MSILNVPESYSSINVAIAAASPGDTIKVAKAFVNNEHVIVNVANLKILGFNAYVDARTRVYNAATESIITYDSLTSGIGIINITEPNVIINGFTIQGTGPIVNGTSGIYTGDAGQYPQLAQIVLM